MKKILRAVLLIVLTGIMLFSGYQVAVILRESAEEKSAHEELVQQYKPQPQAPDPLAVLRAEYPAVLGWLTVPGTKIDHPFVQAQDNDHYLRRNLDGEHANGGTVFMECRNSPDFSDFNTVLYGHNMRNDTMFGTLELFEKQDFFNQNRSAEIILPDRKLALEIFACAVVDADDESVYGIGQAEEAEITEYLTYLKSKAKFWRDPQLAADDHIVTLSTCSYAFDNARTVVVCKIK